MAKRSENAIVGITNLTCCFLRVAPRALASGVTHANNFAIIETGVLQEKQFLYFCLFLAITLCNYP